MFLHPHKILYIYSNENIKWQRMDSVNVHTLGLITNFVSLCATIVSLFLTNFKTRILRSCYFRGQKAYRENREIKVTAKKPGKERKVTGQHAGT